MPGCPTRACPTYTGLFGRDTLTAAWQAALLGPEMMRGALERVGERQATADDPWRDAEPGKLVHEVRRGPLSELDVIPQSAYYGTQTTPAMYVLALSELWHWTGDTAVLARYRDVGLVGDGVGAKVRRPRRRRFPRVHDALAAWAQEPRLERL